MYSLHREQIVDTSIKKAWEFVSNPFNLNAITPTELNFRIISDLPDKMFNGLVINYKIYIPILGYQEWVTEIKHISAPYSFVDEQRIGPFKFWYHYHAFEEVKDGINFIDNVYYDVPFSFLGRIVHRFFVIKMLTRIFDYRREKLTEIFTPMLHKI